MPEKISRRKFVKAGLVAVAGYSCFRALDEGLKEINKTPAQKAYDWYIRLDESTQNSILNQIEELAMGGSHIGSITSDAVSKSQTGVNIAGEQVMPDIEEKPFKYCSQTGGQMRPYMDTLEVTRPHPQQGMEALLKGKPSLLERIHHEASHWMADQANPLEDVTDLLKDSGIKLELNQSIYAIKDEIKFDANGNPKNEYTAFLQAYTRKFHPHSGRPLGYHEPEALGKLREFKNKMGDGGLVLMEVQARMLFMETDYSQTNSQTLRENMYAQILNYEGGQDRQRYDQAFDATAKLYAIRMASENDASTAHQLVSKDIGESLLSWDNREKRYTKLSEKINILSKKLGWSGDRVEKEKDAWLTSNISKRAQDQAWIKQMTQEILVGHMENSKKK